MRDTPRKNRRERRASGDFSRAPKARDSGSGFAPQRRRDSEFSSPRRRDPAGRFGSSGADRQRGRFDRDSGSGRFSGSGRRRDASSRLEMHDVVCDRCGRECSVPFKPTSSKPVYCSDCFKKNDSAKGGRSGSADLAVINQKLDKIMKALNID